MKFDLHSYLALNESYNSNILVNSILNEPSGVFKYFNEYGDNYNSKGPNDHIITSLGELDKKIWHINTLFFNYGNKCYIANDKCKWNDNFELTINEGHPLYDKTEDEIEKFIQYYESLNNSYITKMQNLFNRPHPKILTTLLAKQRGYRTHDINKILNNLTDDCFKKLTFKEFKDGGYITIPNTSKLTFFFQENGELLGATSYNENDKKHILFFINPLASYINFNTTWQDYPAWNLRNIRNKEIFDKKVNFIKDYTKWTHDITLIIKDKRYEIKNALLRLSAIGSNDMDNKTPDSTLPEEFLTLNSVFDFYKEIFFNNTALNLNGTNKTANSKITLSSSNIRKIFKWGQSPNDYMLMCNLGKITNNDLKNLNDFYDKRKMNAMESSTKFQNKWQKDIMGRIIPFRTTYFDSNEGKNFQLITYIDSETGQLLQKKLYKGSECPEFFNNDTPCFIDNINMYEAYCKNMFNKRLEQYKSICQYNKSSEPYINQIKEFQINLIALTKRTSSISREIFSISKDKDITEDIKKRLSDLLTDSYNGLQPNINSIIGYILSMENSFNTIIKEGDSIKFCFKHKLNSYSHEREIQKQCSNMNKYIEETKTLIEKYANTYNKIIEILDKIKEPPVNKEMTSDFQELFNFNKD